MCSAITLSISFSVMTCSSVSLSTVAIDKCNLGRSP
jgi:hypothetical protein